MSDTAIKVEQVSKTFLLPHEKTSSIKDTVVNFYKRNRSYERQKVLSNISFEIKEGEFFGIVGRNGSGKSTLLKMLAGIYPPSSGNIKVNGKLTPFIELGVGFNMELTGRENVFLNGALLGFSRQEMLAMYADIVEFAELERFMDQKLKNYSSGMQVRLAFSIAIRANSDILLLDEVLAVGDAIFQQKCFDYFKELKKNKKTVVLVSHDSNALQQYCDKGILIEGGKIIAEGPIEDVVNQYKDLLVSHEKIERVPDEDSAGKRWGSQEVQVARGSILNAEGNNQTIFTDEDNDITVVIRYTSKAAVEQPIFGIIVNDSTGQQIFASNTDWSKVKVATMEPGKSVEVTWTFPNVFNTGTYHVNPAASNSTGTVMYDWRDDFIRFKIRKKLESTAKVNIAHKVIAKSLSGKESK
jgi:ABC-2 type transport system ATP-binding protein